MKKRSERQTLCAAYAGRVCPSSLPNFKRIALFIQKLLGGQKFRTGSPDPATPTYGSFYGPYAGRHTNTVPCLCRQGLSSISVPNLKRIALFIQKVLGVPKFRNWVNDPGHAHLGVVLHSIRRRGPSSISLPNLKQIAQFFQKLLRGHEIRSCDPATPT